MTFLREGEEQENTGGEASSSPEGGEQQASGEGNGDQA